MNERMWRRLKRKLWTRIVDLQLRHEGHLIEWYGNLGGKTGGAVRWQKKFEVKHFSVLPKRMDG